MFDLGKLAFDSTFQLLSVAIDKRLKTSEMSFLEQRKIRNSVETAAVDFADGLVSFLEKQRIPQDQQQRLIDACVRELKPFAENSQETAGLTDGQEIFDNLYEDKDLPEGIDDEIKNIYSFLFSRFATFLFKISASFSDWDSGTLPENIQRFDKALLELKTLFTQTNKSSRAPQKEVDKSALENLSFDVPDFSEEGEAGGDDVSFTAMYPREIGVETWNTLLVYAHLTSAIESIKKDSERFKDQLSAPKEVTVASSTPLARGTEIAIVPQCEGITFNPQRINLAWLEDFHRADFRFRADKSLADDAAKGHIDIYVGPLIVGTLKLALLVGETAPQNTTPQEEHGTIYHQDDIFISYSHTDTDIVLPFKKAYEAIGNNILIDIDTLRSGQDWNAELLKMIERAEIFQLFWSESSSQSKYCRQEWEYALKREKEGGFIRPCYWQRPMPTPPAELQHLHFEYVQI
jgi:hypothetical protein